MLAQIYKLGRFFGAESVVKINHYDAAFHQFSCCKSRTYMHETVKKL